MNYLSSSQDIKSRLHQVFAGPGQKWAVVAFVGYGALDQLPEGIENLSIICWPKPGATHPDGIRRLLKVGVRVYFCNNLHTKLYWAEGGGVIIGSANLSRNALANSGQHEFAVFIEDISFDIDTVLAALSYREVTDESLAALDTAYVAASQKDPDSDGVPDLGKKNRPPLSFLESRSEALPRKWKLIVWSELRDTNEFIKQAVIAKTGRSQWTNDNDVESDHYEVGDFVLQVRVGGDELIYRANCRWLRADLITNIRGVPPAIVQLTSLENGPPPPFEIDSQFSKGFKSLYNGSTGDEIIDNKMVVKTEFIQKIQALYKDVNKQDQIS